MGIRKGFIEKVWRLKEKLAVGLVSEEIRSDLIDNYGANTGHNFDLGQNGDLGYGLLHYALIKNLKPSRVLCIGSGKGFVPAICSLACKDNKKGHVDFVDAGYGKGDDNSWGGFSFWRKNDPAKHFSVLGLSNWISTYVMKSEDFSRMGSKQSWQYIYIDADHSYQGVSRDYKLFWPRLEKGGYMVFHDVLIKSGTNGMNYGVEKFWKKLSNKNKITIPFTIPWGTPSGLGILQKT